VPFTALALTRLVVVVPSTALAVTPPIAVPFTELRPLTVTRHVAVPSTAVVHDVGVVGRRLY
jgi:hypothetical protein